MAALNPVRTQSIDHNALRGYVRDSDRLLPQIRHRSQDRRNPLNDYLKGNGCKTSTRHVAPSFRPRQFFASLFFIFSFVILAAPSNSYYNLDEKSRRSVRDGNRGDVFFRKKFILCRKSTRSAFSIVCESSLKLTFLSESGRRGGVRKGKWVNADLRARTRESICESIFAPAIQRPCHFERRRPTSSRRGRRKSIATAVCADARCSRQSSPRTGKIERTKKKKAGGPRVGFRGCNKRDDGRRRAGNPVRGSDMHMRKHTCV